MTTISNYARYYMTIMMIMSISIISYAGTITVDSTNATMGMTSLRTAVTNAMSGDTIRFSSAIDGDTIKLATEISLDKNLVIIGNDTMSTIIDGMNTSRIFHIPAGDTVSISGIKMQGGNGVGAASNNNGGAINNQGMLTVTNSTVSGNSASNFGGGIFNRATLTLTNSTVSGNSADFVGGGIYNDGSAATLTVTYSTVSGNSADFGGGIFNFVSGTLTVTNSTVSGNSATSSDGGGIYNFGPLTVTNSTVSGNSASNNGGGIFNIGSPATLKLTNSIVAKNNDNGSGPDISNNATLNDGGHNLIGDGTGQTAIIDGTNNNIVGVDPLFFTDVDMSSLPNSTGDLRLQCGSAAIDAGSNAAATAAMVSSTDINGNPRIITKTIDIGAYEFQPSEFPTDINLVTNVNDSGCGSLRFAVCNAMAGDTIRFDASLNMDTIKLITEIVIDTNLVILGNDTTNTIIDGMATSRIFHIPAGDTVSITGIKMQRGNGEGAFQPLSSTSGGAIYNQGSINLTNSKVRQNFVSHSGGGIYSSGDATLVNCSVIGNSAVHEGGGVANRDTMTLTNCTVSGNSASGQFGNGGGIANIFGAVTLVNSKVSENFVSHFGGGLSNKRSMTLFNSTVSGNSAMSSGGGLHNFGNGFMTLTNSSVSGNSSFNSGGGGSNTGNMTLINCTVSGNFSSNNGGGLSNLIFNKPMILTNSIVAKNNAPSGPDIHLLNDSKVTDSGYNLIGDTTGVGSSFMMSTLLGNTVVPIDPLFVTDVDMSSLPNSTGDLRLQCGSPAIDMGNNANNSSTKDILGNPRKVGTIDIGAYERPADTGSKIVTTIEDDGPGSLRDLVRTACAGDTIRFDASLNMDTIKLITEIILETNLVILGNDTTNTIIDGMNSSRIFHIPAGDTVSISGIKMQGGNGVGVQFMNATNNTGGAIFNRGFLILANSILTGNNALGISAGGALTNLGTVIVTDCIFSHNTGAAGAGFANGGIATLINSIFHGNSSLSIGGGLSNFGLGHSTVINSTFSDNSAVNEGGGIHNNLGIVVVTNSSLSSNDSRRGGGLYNGDFGKVTLTNTTLNGNVATQRGGGLYNEDSGSEVTLINSIASGNATVGDGGGLSNRFGSRVTLTNSTLSGNTADRFGGGLYNESTGSIATLTNTIIAKNNDNGSGPDIYKLSGTITDQGHNLIGDTTSVAADFTISALLGNTANPVDPLFVLNVPTNDSLGGDLRLKCGSPAIDAGKADTTGLNLGLVDLGGNPRIITKTIDIGAYELQASDAPAPTTLVTNANDSGCGSLRFAVCNAMAGDTIRFDASLDMDTIKLITEIVIDTNLVIIGNDTTNTIIDGMNTSRIFHIPAGDTVSISGIKMQGGNGASPIQPFIAGSSTYGGAIYNQGTLTLTNCKLSGNLSHHRGGAVYNSSTFSCTNTTLSSNSSIHGGGLYSAGTFSSVEMSNCTVIGNSAFIGAGVANNDSGSAIISDCMFIDNIGTGNGSGVYNTGQLTLTNSQFFGNKTDSDESQAYGGGVYNSGMAILSNIKFVENLAISGGGIANSGTMTMVKSSVSANSAIFPFGNGGGVYNTGILAMTNSTISGNTASSSGGGIDNLGEMMLTNGIISGNKAESDGGGVNNASSSTLTLTNSTVSGNSTSRLGGGIYNRIGTLMLTNSIVAKNTDNGSGPDIYKDGGTITDEGHNVIGDTTSVGSDFMISTLLGNTANPVDPLFVLDVPANDSLGGDLSLRICSPAIDAGLIAAVPKDTFDIDMDLDSMEILPLDLAGQDRVFGTAVDIGAYETQQLTTDPLVVMNTNDDGPQSLRYLVDIACAGDTITFDASLDMDTIKLITEIVIDTNLVILGNDTTNTIIDGMANSRLFYIPLGDTVYISGMTLRNGNGIGAIDLEEGGAILNKGVVHIANCRINANSARRQGGGIYSQGTVTLVDSEVSDNFAFTIGGVGNDNGMLMVVNSRINSNIAGGTGSGGLSNNGMAIITNSTISGNQAAIGGGLLNSGTMTFTNGIISGNVANVSRAGGLLNSGAITVINTTISGNFSRSGGGGMVSNGAMLMANSIIAKNTSSLGADITATGGITDWGHNLIGDTTEVANLFSVSTLKGGAGINALDPLFIMDVPTAPSTGGDLRLQCGSPAIDAGTPDTMGLNLGLVDILGLPRIESAGGTIDIGAHERPADMGSKIVTTLADDGQGSLRDIVGTACPGDTITFAANLTMDTINLITEITLDKNLVIIGNDTTNTIIDGMNSSRIFHISAGDTVSISGIKMQGGNGTGSTLTGKGGAILNEGTSIFFNTTISGNTASESGGGVSNFSAGTSTFTNTTISGNIAFQGGGVHNFFGTSTFSNTTITGNTSNFGGGLYVGSSGTSIFTNTTISGNTASGSGGGVYNQGTSTFTNTTISGNAASFNGGAILNQGPSTFTNTTISGNTASLDGGGIYNVGMLTLTNSIVAKNTDNGSGPDVFNDRGTINDGGHNLIGDNTSVATEFPAGLFVGMTGSEVDPLFITDVDTMSLPNNTGDLRLRICSPAVDAGLNSALPKDTFDIDMDLDSMEMLPLDLTGEDRVFSTAVDIGAYETQQSSADPLIVMNADDDGPMSLRYLVDIACAGDTIRFDSGIDGDTIRLSSGEITLDTTLVIIGNGSSNTIIDGMSNNRIFYIPPADTVTITGVTIQNGNGAGTRYNGLGGAIYNRGLLSIRQSNISGHQTSDAGGGIYNSGSLELSNSVIKGNLAQLGGGLYNDPGTLIMINSTVSGNSATNIGGGLFSLNGTIALINNIIAQNTDGGDGPDIFNRDILIDGGHNLIGDTTNLSTNFMMSTLLGNMTAPLDPQFVTPVDLMSLPNASGDLRLGCGSPAIDAGTPDTSGLNLGAVDFGGFARVSGKRIDIGAQEAIADCHEIDLLDMNSMSIPDSATIVFGQVTVVTTDTIYIKNIGAHQIFIDSITIASIGTNTGSYTYNTTSFTQPDTIACGDSLLLSITFDPQALGVDSALLRIYNNDADEGVYDLILSGAKTTALTAPIISGPLAVCSNGVWSTQPQAPGTSYQWKFDNIPINAPSASTANLNYIPPYDGMLSVEISNTFEQLSASQGVLLTEPELCELLKCDEVRLYLDGEFLNHENIQTDVRVISSIQSNGTVNSDEFFRFYAGDSIVLLELFEVELGGVFEAQIESCQTMNTLMDSWSEEEQKGTKEERKAIIIRAIRSLKD